MKKVIYKLINYLEPVTEIQVAHNAQFLNVALDNKEGIYLHFLIDTTPTDDKTVRIHCVTDDRPFDADNVKYLGEARLRIKLTADEARAKHPMEFAKYDVFKDMDIHENLRKIAEQALELYKTESYHLFMEQS